MDDVIQQAGEVDRMVRGLTVSVDVSTGDHDAEARMFARVVGTQDDGCGVVVLLAELVEDTRRHRARWGRTGRPVTVTKLPPALGREISTLWDERDAALAQLGLVRDALRRAGCTVDEVAGEDLAGLVDRQDRQARDLVARIGAETARLRAALENIAAAGDTAGADFCRVGAVGLARILRGFADRANRALNEEDQHEA